MNLSVSLGDLIVAGSVVVSIYAAYNAMKAQIAGFSAQLTNFKGRIDAHANRLMAHGRTLNTHGHKIAGLEGRVFGRRVEDVLAPPAEDDADAAL